MTGGGVDSKWFKTSWAVLVLLALGVHRMAKMEDPFIGDVARWDILDDIMAWIALAGTVALFVRENVVNYRIGPRFFWRRWNKWSTALAGGIMIFVVFLFVMIWIKPHSILNRQTAFICSAVIIGVDLIIKFVANYMYKHAGEKIVK